MMLPSISILLLSLLFLCLLSCVSASLKDSSYTTLLTDSGVDTEPLKAYRQLNILLNHVKLHDAFYPDQRCDTEVSYLKSMLSFENLSPENENIQFIQDLVMTGLMSSFTFTTFNLDENLVVKEVCVSPWQPIKSDHVLAKLSYKKSSTGHLLFTPKNDDLQQEYLVLSSNNNLVKGQCILESKLQVVPFAPYLLKMEALRQHLRRIISKLYMEKSFPSPVPTFTHFQLLPSHLNNDDDALEEGAILAYLDVCFRCFAWQQAKLRSESRLLQSLIFKDIYGRLWMHVLHQSIQILHNKRLNKGQQLVSILLQPYKLHVKPRADSRLFYAKSFVDGKFALEEVVKGESCILMGPFAADPLTYDSCPLMWQSFVIVLSETNKSSANVNLNSSRSGFLRSCVLWPARKFNEIRTIWIDDYKRTVTALYNQKVGPTEKVMRQQVILSKSPQTFFIEPFGVPLNRVCSYRHARPVAYAFDTNPFEDDMECLMRGEMLRVPNVWPQLVMIPPGAFLAEPFVDSTMGGMLILTKGSVLCKVDVAPS